MVEKVQKYKVKLGEMQNAIITYQQQLSEQEDKYKEEVKQKNGTSAQFRATFELWSDIIEFTHPK